MSRRIGSAVILGASMVVVLGLALRSRADDHADSPRAIADPGSDLTDFYAFMRPNPDDAGKQKPSTHLVLVATLRPRATQAPDAGLFSDRVVVSFRIQRSITINPPTFAPTDLRVVCSFANSTPQTATCNAPGIGIHDFQVGAVDAGGPSEDIRVFAGLRADPTFFDRTALEESLSAGTLKFQGTGNNIYAGQNVLGLVVELNVAKAFNADDAGSPTPVLAVAVETSRQ